MGGGIGGGLGYVLSNRLKNPNLTRHALMSVTFGIFGFNVVQFTGIKVGLNGRNLQKFARLDLDCLCDGLSEFLSERYLEKS